MGQRKPAGSLVVQSKAFSERLEAAIARYHANAITTAQVLEELNQLAKDIRAARSRGEEQGLSDEEIAFYDARRDLLYVACTRARDHLFVNGVNPASEFLERFDRLIAPGGSDPRSCAAISHPVLRTVDRLSHMEPTTPVA